MKKENLKERALNKNGKGKKKNIGEPDPINLVLNRRLSVPLSIRLMRTRVTPNQVTILSLVCAIFAGIFFAMGSWVFLIIAAIFVELYITLDLIDGELARLKNMKSDFGRWFEGVVDNVATALILIGMFFGALNSPQILWYQFPVILLYLSAFFAIVGYYITAYSYYYGKVCFEGRNVEKGSGKTKSKGHFLLKSVKGYSRGFQILIFVFAGLFNQLLVGLILFALWSNLIWIGRVVKYYKEYRKNQGGLKIKTEKSYISSSYIRISFLDSII
jgi:phosphatidylglycerophosphate synthase